MSSPGREERFCVIKGEHCNQDMVLHVDVPVYRDREGTAIAIKLGLSDITRPPRSSKFEDEGEGAGLPNGASVSRLSELLQKSLSEIEGSEYLANSLYALQIIKDMEDQPSFKEVLTRMLQAKEDLPIVNV